mgnify:CR=1 FL=1
MRLRHNCYHCRFRHERRGLLGALCEKYVNTFVKKSVYDGCPFWRLGKCYVCQHRNASDDEWYMRGCETYCMGGCRKFKRDWKATWKWLMHKEVDEV